MGNTKYSKRTPAKFKPYIQLAHENGIHDAVLVTTLNVFTAPWVRMKCQFGCAFYGDHLCCPPYTPTPDEMRNILDSYTNALLLHVHWEKGYKMVNRFNDVVVDLERTIFLDGYYKAWSLGSGPCDRCELCNLSSGCINADKARPSMESCGIDVFKTAREHGLPISVVRDHNQERDIYGLVLVE
jgi:predicted metal-binding protein